MVLHRLVSHPLGGPSDWFRKLYAQREHDIRIDVEISYLESLQYDFEYRQASESREYVERGKPGVELGFPHAPWSTPYVAGVHGELERQGVRYTVQNTESSPVTAFTIADFGTDVERAQQAITAIFGSVFQADPEREGIAHFEGGLDPNVRARIGFT